MRGSPWPIVQCGVGCCTGPKPLSIHQWNPIPKDPLVGMTVMRVNTVQDAPAGAAVPHLDLICEYLRACLCSPGVVCTADYGDLVTNGY